VAVNGAGRRDPIVFLFSGQGSQYRRMGEGLYRVEPVFRNALDKCFALFAAAGINVADVLFDDDETPLSQTLYSQPALFALQTGRPEIWRTRGVEPAAVIGHSIGEFAAAVAAGVCSLEDAAHLVATRARLMTELPERGCMLAVGTDAETLRDAWPDGRDGLAVA